MAEARAILTCAGIAALAIASRGAMAGDPAFIEIAEELGIAAPHLAAGYVNSVFSGGGAAGDFNNDGCQDLFVLSGGLGDHPDRLYINNCDGTFTESAGEWGLAEVHQGKGVSVADYDGDGLLDIYITSAGPVGDAQPGHHRLYHNGGDNTFSELATFAGVSTTAAVEDGWGSGWGDFDLDGDLDLFVAGHAPNNSGSRLFENNGDGTFTDITAAIGFFDNTPISMAGFTPIFADTNGDLYPELLFAADFGTSRFFANLGNGTFADLTIISGTSHEENGMGATIGDFNVDGNLDWYVTSIYDPPSKWTGNKLYHGSGGYTFSEVSGAAGVVEGGWGWGTVAVDFNHDGRLDIAETNGATGSFANEQSYLWVQNPDGTFTEMALATGFVHLGDGRGMINLDYDNDGDQDVMIFANNERPYFFRNEIAGPDAHWLRVFLDTDGWPGLAPDGNGAKVYATAGGQTQMRYMSAGPTFLSFSELSAHFGLGTVAVVDEVRVDWPDGSSTFLANVPANNTITLTPGGVTGDADGDGIVGINDFLAVLGNWGECPDPCPPTCLGDLDTDCEVGIADFLIVLGNWTP